MPQHTQFHKFPPIWTGRKLGFYYITKHRILSIFGDFFTGPKPTCNLPPPPSPLTDKGLHMYAWAQTQRST